MEILRPLIGGLLIGLAAILLLFANGKVAGISGMLGAVVTPGGIRSAWRYAFLGGLVAGGAAFQAAGWTVFAPLAGRSWGAVIAAGLLVGIGTQIGGGCTSGHGVCGVARFSKRSIVATLVFIIAGAITVAVVQRGLGGRL